MIQLQIGERKLLITFSSCLVFLTAFFGNINFYFFNLSLPMLGQMKTFSVFILFFFVYYIISWNLIIEVNENFKIILALLLMILWGVGLLFGYGRFTEGFSTLFSYIILLLAIFLFSAYLEDRSLFNAWFYGYWISMVILALMGLYESFTGDYIHAASGNYLNRVNSWGLYYPKTVFYNINDMATAMTFAFLLSWIFFTCIKPDRKLKAASIVLFGINIAIGGSRGALYAVVIFVALVMIRKLPFRQIINWFIVIIAVFGIAFLSENLIGFFEEEGRLSIWINSLYNLANSHFLGVGPGMISDVNASSQLISSSVTAVHNFVIEVFCEFGIFGLIFIVVCFVSMWINYRNMELAGNETEKRVALYLKDVLIAFFAISITSSSLTGKASFISFFAFMIACGSIFKAWDNKADYNGYGRDEGKGSIYG